MLGYTAILDEVLSQGVAIHFNARLNPTTLNGTWINDYNEAGTLTFQGSVP